MNFLEKINITNIILSILVLSITLLSYIYDFSFEEILFFISKFDIIFQSIMDFIFGIIIGIGAEVGGIVGVSIIIIIAISVSIGIGSSVSIGVSVGVIFGVFSIVSIIKINNFIKEKQKKITFLILVSFLITSYYIFDRKFNFTNKFFNYEYKNYLLNSVNINNKNNLKVLNRILELIDINSTKAKDLQISIKTFALLSEYYKNTNDKQKVIEYLKKSSEVIIKLINSKVEDRINPAYFFLNESFAIDKEIVLKNQKAIIEFNNRNFQKAKEIFNKCLSSFKELDEFGIELIKKNSFKSEIDFNNFAKLNINLANTLFKLHEYKEAIEYLNLALKSAYSFDYINNPYTYYI